MKIFQDKQFFSVLLSVQTTFFRLHLPANNFFVCVCLLLLLLLLLSLLLLLLLLLLLILLLLHLFTYG